MLLKKVYLLKKANISRLGKFLLLIKESIGTYIIGYEERNQNLTANFLSDLYLKAWMLSIS